MIAARQAPLDEQLRALFRRVGREYWPLRTNLHLPEKVKTRAVEREMKRKKNPQLALFLLEQRCRAMIS